MLDPQSAALLDEAIQQADAYEKRILLRSDFVRCWLKDDSICVEDYCQQLPFIGQDSPLLLDLLTQEIELRQTQGARPTLEEYVARFPQLQAGLQLLFAIETGESPMPDSTPESTPAPPEKTHRRVAFSWYLLILLTMTMVIAVLLVKHFHLQQAIRALETESTQRQNEAKNETRSIQQKQSERQQLAQDLYRHQLQFAQQIWNIGNAQQAKRILAQTNPTLRHWEYEYLFTKMHLLGQKQFPSDQARIHLIQLSANGKLIALVDVEGRVQIRDIQSGRQIQFIESERGIVRCLAFSENGQRLAIGTTDGSIRIHDVRTGRRQLLIVGHDQAVIRVTFHANGERLLSLALDGTCSLWDAHIGKQFTRNVDELPYVQFLTTQASRIQQFALCPKEKRIALLGQDHRVRCFDVESGRLINVIRVARSTITAISFRPDGQELALGTSKGMIYLHQMKTGKERLRLINDESVVRQLQYLPDGKRVFSVGSDGVVRLWDAQSGQTLSQTEAYSLSIHPEERHLQVKTPDGQRKFIAQDDGSIALHIAGSDRPLLTLLGRDRKIIHIQFTEESALTVDYEDEVRLQYKIELSHDEE